MFRKLRILLLLAILLFVALGAWLDRARSTDWDNTLWVAIYPIAVDGSEHADRYIRSLSSDTFGPIARFMKQEARRYRVALEQPVRVLLYERVFAPPPELNQNSGVLGRALWSLRLRYWAWRASSGQNRPPPDVRIFVLYHDPTTTSAVPHSIGLQKGLLGLVHAFASPDMTASNNIVIAHEFLHTLGATDKYDLNNRPVYPGGFAEPDRRPLYPQDKAEVMAGRRMLAESQMDMPESLASVVVGPATALEIGWAR